MSRKYKIWSQEFPHFISFATVHWVDVFTRRLYFDIMIKAITHCIEKKDLIIYGWCIMSSHVHLIIGTRGMKQQDIIRDLKRDSAKQLLQAIYDNPQESRKEWILEIFRNAGQHNRNNKLYQFWQQHNQPLEIYNRRVMDNFLTYIHRNPVVSGVVGVEQHYTYSSAVYYCGVTGLIKIENVYL